MILSNILFIDIETVTSTDRHDQLSERLKTQWSRKCANMRVEDDLSDADLYHNKGAIFSEFGKIIVIGIGFFVYNENNTLILRIKSLRNHDEKQLLTEFCEVIGKFPPKSLRLCGHNSKEFDIPYLSRRMLINNIALPHTLDLSDKKPWEIPHLDTMQMWKFGDYKHYTSLDLLASVFDIPSSKSDIDGSQVGKVYYQDNDLDKIAEYCERDIAVTAQLYLKLKSIHTFEPENIVFLK